VVALRSSMERIAFCFDSLFSVIIPIILSRVLGWAFTASIMEVALLTSILCLRSFSSCLNLLWKYRRKSSTVADVSIFEPGSSTTLMLASTSLAYKWKGLVGSGIDGVCVCSGSSRRGSMACVTISLSVSSGFSIFSRKLFSMNSGLSCRLFICLIASRMIVAGSSVVDTRVRKSNASLLSW